MKRKLFFLVLILVSVLRPVAGQEPCFYKEIEHNSAHRGNCENVESVDSAIIKVVFHVVHIGEPYGAGFNIHDTVIRQAVEQLNNNYKNQIFGVDSKIRFVLADADPNGNPSNGISRHDGSGLPKYVQFGVNGDTSLGCPISYITSSAPSWDETKYLNFWVISKTYNNWSGMSTPNGLFVVSQGLTTDPTLCAHEVGHYLGLMHTFNGYTYVNGQYVCPKNNDCNLDGDKICDTPPNTPYDYGSPCVDGDLTNSKFNFMNYGLDLNLFTSDQIKRMWDVLRNQRCGLISNASVVSGIGNNISKKITLFPNPTTGKIFFIQNIGIKSDVQVKVYNLVGEVVYQSVVPASDKNFDIDLSGKATSVYIVSLAADGITALQKIILN